MENSTTYIVRDIITEAPDVKTLKLTLENGTVPLYNAGQFITVYFPETKTVEGKAYSFSSAPHQPTCNITVKKIGEFSGRLCAMQKGDRITASMPYGFFASEFPHTELVAIAGGIGITPLKSILAKSHADNPNRRMRLFYSVKHMHDIIFIPEFEMISQTNSQFSAAYYVTQQEDVPSSIKKGRIDVRHAVSQNKPHQTEYLICGSISFVRDMWKGLRQQGVPEDSIYTEAFFR